MPLFHVSAAASVFIMEIVVPYDIGYVLVCILRRTRGFWRKTGSSYLVGGRARSPQTEALSFSSLPNRSWHMLALCRSESIFVSNGRVDMLNSMLIYMGQIIMISRRDSSLHRDFFLLLSLT
jgi:hypothetical protein